MRPSPIVVIIFFGSLAVCPPAKSERSTRALESELETAAANLGAGYVRVGKTRAGGLSKGQIKRFSYLLRAGSCYRFLAVGGKLLKDLDLRIFDGDTLLVADSGAVERPLVQYCVKRDVQAEARLQAFKGRGQYAFAVYSRDGGRADEVNTAEGSELVVKRALDEAQKAVASEMEQVGDAYSAELGHRQAKTVEFELDKPRCYKFIAVGGPGVTDLSLAVLVDGKEVASDKISGKRPVVEWCAPGKTKAAVKISMYGGAGSYAVGAFGAKAGGTRSAERVGGPGSDFVANRMRQLHARFGKGRAAISPFFKGNLSTGNEQVFKVRLQVGHCYTIIGTGSPSVRNLDIVLLDPAGREVYKDAGSNNYPTMDTKPCPQKTGKYTVKVRMFSGFGQFGVQVFSD